MRGLSWSEGSRAAEYYRGADHYCVEERYLVDGVTLSRALVLELTEQAASRIGGCMCVAYPGKVLGIEDRTAEVDFDGNVARVNIGLVDVKEGDYVLVHAGMAIEAMDEEKARGLLETWEQLQELSGR